MWDYFYVNPSLLQVTKDMKFHGEAEMLHELVHDTTWISSWFSEFSVVSWTNSCTVVSRFPGYIYLFSDNVRVDE